jgi:RNA polymerase sigma-70 factor (ECF subfamily)
MQPVHDVTQMLQRWRAGDQAAFDRVLVLVYDQLKTMARGRLRGERQGLTLDTTGLVHELYLKLAGQGEAGWENRAHVLAIASLQMKRILIDHAERRRALKRGGGQHRVALDEEVVLSDDQAEALLELNDALGRLEAISPRQSKAVELRFFGGLTLEEVGDVLGVNASTVLRDLRIAQAWLAREWHGTLNL